MRYKLGVMQRWLAVVLLSALLGACSDGRRGSAADDTKYSVGSKRTEATQGVLDLIDGSSTDRSKDEVLAIYLPGKTAKHLKEADYLEASDRAVAKLDFNSAVILCTEAIKLAPSDPTAYFKRGRARLDSGTSNSAQTLADLEKATSLNCRDPKAHELLAIVYDSRSQRDKAIESINKAIKINPTNSGTYKLKAALHAAYGDKESARKDYDAWIAVMPSHPLPYVLRGQLLQSMKEYDKALADYKKVCTLPEVPNSVSNRAMAFRLRANLLSKLGRHKEAVAAINEGLELDGADDELFLLRGDEYMVLKEFQKAIADYTKSVSNAPDFAGKALQARGKAYAAVGDEVQAKKDFLKAKELLEKPAEKPIY